MIINSIEGSDFFGGTETVEYELYFNTRKVGEGVSSPEQRWVGFLKPMVANKVKFRPSNIVSTPIGWSSVSFGFTLRPLKDPLASTLIKRGSGTKSHRIYARYADNGTWVEEDLPNIVTQFTNIRPPP